jgi:hypothetical protein
MNMNEVKIVDNLTDKLTESISNIFKKTEISNKLDKLGYYLIIPATGIFLFSFYSFFSLYNQNIKIRNETIFMSENNTDILNKLEDKIVILNEKISILEKELKEQLEKQYIILTSINNIPLLNIGREEKDISRSSSNVSISIDVSCNQYSDEMNINLLEPESPKNYNFNENSYQSSIDNSSNHVSDFDNKDNEYRDLNDDELLDDCYDSLPLNGVKKVTGLRSLFGF